MALTIFLFYTPLFIIAERGLQSTFLSAHPHLAHDERELAQIDGTDPFQIIYPPEPPVLIFLLLKNANLHQHIHGSRIAAPLALVINCRMYFPNQFFFIHGRCLSFHASFQDSLHLSNQLFLVWHIENIAGCKNIVGQTAQGIFCRDTVFVGTEDNADRRVIVRIVDFRRVIIQVHIELTGGFWRKFFRFQFNQHISAENFIVKHHVHIVVGIVQGHTLLGSDKHKTAPSSKRNFSI